MLLYWNLCCMCLWISTLMLSNCWTFNSNWSNISDCLVCLVERSSLKVSNKLRQTDKKYFLVW
ncbi:unnamed protein product [Chironomus riparius]|uniref:Uncharacterized protein n=1 Tax=Chironomus riparius TaxID=315576 RepID=A0A9N9RU43_9DIPT|nr:unnamed protein product [Chironomus riparius]